MSAGGDPLGADENAPAAKTESEREQIKLQAAYLNGIAIGLMLIGGFSVPASIVMNNSSRIWIALAVSVLCFCGSPIIHWAAKRSLKELDR
ncbi:hypothetical protein [Fulvimarina sp. MAC8]|uniref:hypothetical protein n=1 Tax=Fulvimarina sp. MAC8 TaxID=3162874 RepID=UPI0032EC27E7